MNVQGPVGFWNKVASTAGFDYRRSLTPGRLSAFAVLALFPPAITAICLLGPGLEAAPVIVGVTVMTSGVLAELLWATPIVYAELEGKTWPYLAARPRGVAAVLLGKYLVAALWTAAVCGTGLTLCVLLAAAAGVPGAPRMWLVFSVLILLAAFAYAAVFALIGVLFHRRSMVFAMAYVVLLEGVVAQVPAVVNQVTVRHHLTALAVKWLDFRRLGDEEVPDFVLREMLGAHEPDWRNVATVAAVAAVALAASLGVISRREYVTADEA